MSMSARLKAFVPFLIPALAAALAAGAAGFDPDAGRVVLRRIQFCLDCGAALLVTREYPGVLIRCPDCGREQPRLADEHLLIQAYQLCRLCQLPLDPGGRASNDVVECSNCHTRQPLSPDAFPSGPAVHGLGYVPGFPPGSGKKRLSRSPERPDGPITPVPLPLDGGFLPIPPGVVPVPQPPPAESSRPDSREAKAVDVPAVTAELFAGTFPGPGLAGGGKEADVSVAVACRVDGTAIYRHEVDRIAGPAIRRLREKAEDGERLAAIETGLRREVMERLIDRELAVREAAALGFLPDPAEVRRREAELERIFPPESGIDYRREAGRDVAMATMRRRFASRPGAVSPREVREYYQSHRELFRRPRLLALAQLAIFEDRSDRADRREMRAIAGEIAAALEQGIPFARLKAERGEFPDDPAAGGPPLLPEAAYASGLLAAGGDLRRGAVFGPAFLEGLAVFCKVADERPAGIAPFAEVEGDIRSRLEAESAENAMNEWLRRLRRKARVEIFPE
ncbi:MAG: peptidylprolyl isomerase [Planctomycetota bacterium]|jgi:peptidyl-prolyl cis-trans isomerase C|nr:peptidylprolyl isomerase [Planctomycetota bacterium]